MLKYFTFFILISLLWSCNSTPEVSKSTNKQDLSPLQKVDLPYVEFDPETYVCYKTTGNINVDGKLDDADWKKAAWTNEFINIEGRNKKKPTYPTKIKMLYDDDYLYIGAYLEEPHVWAKLKQRDTVIYYDNDFEIFIDPDWDTHNYLEYEVNAFNTVWDLLLTKPYRVPNYAIDHWSIRGLKSAIFVDGTINNPNDTDKAWFVEVAIPMDAILETGKSVSSPEVGEQWRISFSRVQWDMEIKNGGYVKKKGSNGEKLPEHNWVWSPQYEIAMHKPEFWGVIQFSGENTDNQITKYKQNPDWDRITYLRNIYYAQVKFMEKYKSYSNNYKELITDNSKWIESTEIAVLGKTYTVKIPSSDGKHNWYIREDGRMWKE